MTTTKQQDSFLHDTQLEGRGKGDSGKMPIEFLDEAIGNVHRIMKKDVLEEIKDKPIEELEPVKMAIYCHDCRGIVPPGIGKGFKGQMRTVCGLCNSKKISSGRREALESYYHIPKERHGIDLTPEDVADKKKAFSEKPRSHRPPKGKKKKNFGKKGPVHSNKPFRPNNNKPKKDA